MNSLIPIIDLVGLINTREASLTARISASLTQEKTSDIISDVRSLYVVPDGDQAPGVDSDGYRVGLKRKVAGISVSV